MPKSALYSAFSGLHRYCATSGRLTGGPILASLAPEFITDQHGLVRVLFSTSPQLSDLPAVARILGDNDHTHVLVRHATGHASLGAANSQGQAYGALEMGRGIGEALSAAATLALFAYLGSDAALKAVIGLFSAIILGLGIASIFVLRKDSGGDLVESRSTDVNFDTVERHSACQRFG